MSRTVIVCPQPGHPKYVEMFKEWAVEMDKRYVQVVQYIHLSDNCSASKLMAMKTNIGMLTAFRQEFVLKGTGWLMKLEGWHSEIRAWFEACKVLNLNGKGNMAVTQEWEDWLTGLDTWMDEVRAWFVEVEIILAELVNSYSVSVASWEASDTAWRNAMNGWLDGWPMGVIP